MTPNHMIVNHLTRFLSNYNDIEIEYLKNRYLPAHGTSCKRLRRRLRFFVASVVDRAVVERLSQRGVKLILLRCAGFNNVDIEAANEFGITVMRVPGYSPEAVAEHALALAFAVNRHIHKAYIKMRENNFSLIGLTGKKT